MLLDDLEPAVRTVLMKILSAVYESGFVDKIDIGLVLQLFGVPREEYFGPQFLDFTDPQWVDAYLVFGESQGTISQIADEVSDLALPDDQDEFDVRVVNAETGHVSSMRMTREEIEEVLKGDGNIIPEDLSPDRKLH